MAGNIKLEVVTPEKSVVSEEAQIVIAPGSSGRIRCAYRPYTIFNNSKTGHNPL